MVLRADSSTASWPGLSRPSTSLRFFVFQDVDARHKAGHDGRQSAAAGIIGAISGNNAVADYWMPAFAGMTRQVP